MSKNKKIIDVIAFKPYLKRLEENDPELAHLDLYGVANSAQLKNLAAELRNNNTLTSLNLAGNKIDNKGVDAICEILEFNKSLTSLNLIVANQAFDGNKKSKICTLL
jgi:hypothetical protein